jgi:hypothetical protein
MIDRRPALIACCRGVADVINSVNFARAHELLVVVRGGAHNVAGNAVCDGGLIPDQAKFDAVPAGASGRDFAVGEGAAAAGRTVAAARTAGGRAAIMAEVLPCHVFARPDFRMGTAWRRASRPDRGRPARRRASRNPAAPRNAVSPWEAGAPRSAASRWEVAANPWLGAIARCSRTGSSNPSPSSGESRELSVPERWGHFRRDISAKKRRQPQSGERRGEAPRNSEEGAFR